LRNRQAEGTEAERARIEAAADAFWGLKDTAAQVLLVSGEHVERETTGALE